METYTLTGKKISNIYSDKLEQSSNIYPELYTLTGKKIGTLINHPDIRPEQYTLTGKKISTIIQTMKSKL
jgi:hypothetical protein